MSTWLSPSTTQLREVIAASKGHLLLCSPYISTPALNIVAEELPQKVEKLEFWTKLDARDWLTGASDPEGLLDFMSRVERKTGPIAIRYSNHLHAKIILSGGAKAMAGSANLTAGGYMRNIEAARVVTGQERQQLHNVVQNMRSKLQAVSRNDFEKFVIDCTAAIDSKEKLLDLIRKEVPVVQLSQAQLVSYGDFLKYLRSRHGALAQEILRIATNQDGNNNTGKVKQAFFGVQRFLQEYPEHRSTIANLNPSKWFDINQSNMAADWKQFLTRFGQEVNPYYEYSLATLRGYLPVAYGGTLTGGGGGSNELKRVWAPAGRSLRQSW